MKIEKGVDHMLCRNIHKPGPALWLVRAMMILLVVLSVPAAWAAPAADAAEPVFSPQGITEGPEGSLLVTDCYSKVIWIVQEGHREIYAGKPGPGGLYGEPAAGYDDKSRLDMRMNSPWDIVPYMDGYAISDQGNHAVRYIDQKVARTLAGKGTAGYEDNIGGKAMFCRPSGLAAGPEGMLYIADTGNDVVRSLSADGRVDTVVRGLSGPTGLCWHEGTLYVADTGNHRILMVRDGQIVWAAGGEEGLADGSGEQARFSSPGYLTAAGDGTIYVSDTGNGMVRGIRDGQVFTLEWNQDLYPGMELMRPSGLLVRGDQLYVCDSFSRKLFLFPI